MTDAPVFRFGPFLLDTGRHLLFRDGVEVPLSPKLFDLLRLLVEADGRMIDKDQLMTAVWGDAIVEDASLTRAVSRLRAALGDGGMGEEGYIKTVARRGYRFEVPALPQPEPFITPVAHRRRWLLLVAAILGVVAIGGLARWRYLRPDPARPQSLVVLPFQAPDDDPSGEALGLGLADSLSTRMANQTLVAVRPAGEARRVVVDGLDSIAAGRALSADAVLEGTVRRVDGQHRVSARLIDVRSGELVWGATFDETSSSLLDVEDRLVRRLATALAIALDATHRPAHGSTAIPEAYEAYLTGRFATYALTPEAFTRAKAHLDRAVSLDPAFAGAWEALAYLHIDTVDLVAPPREAFPAALAAVNKALALDPEYPDAHATRGLIEWQYNWDWVAAERSFLRALDLAPGRAFGHAQYAFFLASMGRVDESVAAGEQARALEPLTRDFSATNAMTYYWGRQPATAVERIQRAILIDPEFWLSAAIHGRSLTAQDKYADAIRVLEAAVTLDGAIPEALMDLGVAYARAGRRADAIAVLDRLRQVGRQQHVAPFHRAVIEAAVGRPDQAFAELDQMVQARSWYATWVKVDPYMDPLRNDPRFARLLKAIGF